MEKAILNSGEEVLKLYYVQATTNLQDDDLMSGAKVELARKLRWLGHIEKAKELFFAAFKEDQNFERAKSLQFTLDHTLKEKKK